MKPQIKRILEYLAKGEKLTQLIAYQELGILPVSPRITDVKRMGVNVQKSRCSGVNRYGENVSYVEYWLDAKGIKLASKLLNG